MARVLIDSRAALLPFARSARTPDEVRAWVAHTLLPAGGVTLALVDDRVQGVLATAVAADGVGWIEQLYVHPTQVGAGLGRALLARGAGQACRGRCGCTPSRPMCMRVSSTNGTASGPSASATAAAMKSACPDVLYELA